MPDFKEKDLSVLAYANGFTLWHYTTPDAKADIDTSGYFNDAADMLRIGDVIIANTSTGGSPEAGVFVVSANAAGVVDVNDLVSFGTTDTD